VKIDLNKVSGNTGNYTLIIDKLTLNDPCVSNENVLNVCSDEKKEGITVGTHGTCQRFYSNFTSLCKCDDGFEGDACEIQDYCKQIDKVTGKLKSSICTTSQKCIHDHDLNDVSCECKKDEIWNIYSKSCISTKVKCQENAHMQINSAGQASCVCAVGYVAIASQNTSQPDTCVPFEPCNQDHRKSAKITPINPCNNEKNAECVPTGSESSDYYCQCKGGFSNRMGIHEKHLKLARKLIALICNRYKNSSSRVPSR